MEPQRSYFTGRLEMLVQLIEEGEPVLWIETSPGVGDQQRLQVCVEVSKEAFFRAKENSEADLTAWR